MLWVGEGVAVLGDDGFDSSFVYILGSLYGFCFNRHAQALAWIGN